MLNIYHKNKLNSIQKQGYDDLCYGIRNRCSEMRINCVDDLPAIIRAVNYDHPEFFYVNWLDRISYTLCFNYSIIHLNYIYKEQEIVEINRKMKEITRSIAGISNYGKAMGIHDWFVKNIEYDYMGLKQVIRSPGMFSAAGPLIKKRAVCEGISKLACYMMREKGIEATVITGITKNGTPHAWNMLDVGGKNLYVDITYDIGISREGSIKRQYFLLSHEEITRDRRINNY